jgi:hypothetical protein
MKELTAEGTISSITELLKDSAGEFKASYVFKIFVNNRPLPAIYSSNKPLLYFLNRQYLLALPLFEWVVFI